MSDEPEPCPPRHGNAPSRIGRRRFLQYGAAVGSLGGIPGCITTRNEVLDEPGDSPAVDEDPVDEDPVDEDVLAHERAIHERVNLVRREHDRDPLALNPDLGAVARAHSLDMAERNYIAHESPEGDGPDDRLEDFFPVHCRMIGENIAMVGRDRDDEAAVAARIVSGWMDSPGHRENLLREAFDEEGIGVAITADNRVIATQKFCATTWTFG